MRALKAVVIVLGVALVAGSVALVALIVGRMERRSAVAEGAAPAQAALPAGSRIVATELNGDRLLIRLALADGGEELVLINARTGTRIAVFDLPAAR
ncbi:MAG TPA: DUF6476 family protein [Stellaceae bacterium]|nr:DUF6476 family protein [Stellaceae bacterium]